MSLEGNIDTKVLKGKIVDFPNFPMIDDTLTTEGACADAKAAGDADNLLDVKITNNTTRIGNIETKLDGAIENITEEVSASANAVAAEAAKTAVDGAISTGTYTGNGAAERVISLGFKPRAVLLMPSTGYTVLIPRYASPTYYYGGLFTPEMPLSHNYNSDKVVYAEITDNGFKVYYATSGGNSTADYINASNQSGTVFSYIAIR